jgi:branched-chain amino acid transport system substrate-binding protein
MLKSALLLGAALALGPGPAIAQSKSVKIGFVSTFSGPTAVMGNDMRNSLSSHGTILAAKWAASQSR